uniref:Chloride channel CLIC-like protein 1 n=1 Tax=Timema douglasi TaxID=61478 RepID=A0A7R8VT16_TIMDO|nr:unnamed protein product [Timema douglasi]
MKQLLIVLFMSLVDNINTLQYEDSNDLVDPFDMLNYDRATKTMTKSSHLDSYGHGQNQNNLNTCQTSLLNCESNLKALRNKSDETNETRQPSCPLNKQMTYTKHDVDVKVFMKRFVNMLIDAAGMKYVVLEQFTWKDFNIPIAISAEQLTILSDFSKSSDSVSLRALDEVLTNILKPKDSGFAAKYIHWFENMLYSLSWNELVFKLPMYSIFLIPTYMLLMGRSTLKIVTTFLLLTFGVGFVFTFNRMKEVAEIRQYVFQKKHTEVPIQCRPPSELGFWDWLTFGYEQNTDICQKYYENIMLDPGIHVSPHLVLAEMMSTFVLHPASALGNAVGTFSKGVLGSLPWGLNYLVLLISYLAIIVLIIVVLALISGCHINFCGLQVSNHRTPMLRGLQETLRQDSPLAIQPATPGSSPIINISINLPGGGILSNSVEKISSVISSSDSDTHIRNPSLESAEAALPTTVTSDRDDDKSSVKERKSLATCNTKSTVEAEDNVFESELEILSLDNHSQKRKERDACFKSWGVSSDDIEELKTLDETVKEQSGGQESGSDLAIGENDNTNTSGGCGGSSFVMI